MDVFVWPSTLVPPPSNRFDCAQHVAAKTECQRYGDWIGHNRLAKARLTRLAFHWVNAGTIGLNLKELSRVLGLSQTTISRALNDYPEVNAKTRARVIAAARRHGYAPNPQAQRLATGQSRAIGHVLRLGEQEAVNPIFAEFLAGAGEVYADGGYDMLLTVIAETEEVATYRRLATSRAVDAVVLTSPIAGDQRPKSLTEMGLPFVVHGRVFDGPDHAWLDIRNRAAFADATERLLAFGHRRIGLINGRGRYTFAERRENGYRAALTAAGLAPEPGYILSGDLTEPVGYDGARRLLDLAPAPTAILTSSLTQALGVGRALAERGMRPGREVSVVTHDDMLSYMPNGTDAPIFAATTSSIRAAGRRIAEIVIGGLENPDQTPVTELWDVPFRHGPSLAAPQ